MNASPPAPTRRVAALYAIFLVSGFCGLIYESIWSHYLKLLLGHAAYAQAVVLVVFIGGLALGAWLAGRFAERIRRPILWYAAVEALVGVLAFAFQEIFEQASAWATSSFLPQMCGAPGPCGATWLLAAALILPASILLGTTFPLMSTGVMRLGVQPGRGLSLLYFLNSLGAAAGVLASGFLLIPALGLPGTLLLVGSLNAAVALAAYAAVFGVPRRPAPAFTPAGAQEIATDKGQLRLLLAVAAITGLSSFVYEVVWIRMLTLVLGAATHSFELMLATFILGLALGAWWIRDRIDASRDALLLLARIQILMGLLAVATLPLYAACFDAMATVMRALSRSEEGYVLFNLTGAIMACVVMLPATICAGMTLPLVTAILLRRGHGERQVGQVYGVNTLGAILGVLLSVQLLIPALGLKWALAVGAAIDVVLGLWLWRSVQRRRPVMPLATGWRHSPALLAGTGAASFALLAGLTATAPLGPERVASGVFRHGVGHIDPDRHTVLFHRDGKTATVSVLEDRQGTRALLTNGKIDGTTHPEGKVVKPDDHTMVLTGVLGLAHHPQAKKVAVIGLGTGTTSAVLLRSPALEQLETIEIEPMMVEAGQLFRPRTDLVYTDPRSSIVIDDARAHFAKTRARYDLIVSEPSNPWVSGVAGLFTGEFYLHVSDYLAPEGHFVQWLQTYEAGPELASSILRAFSSVFPVFQAYATNSADIILVARRDGKPPTLPAGALDGMPGLQRELLPLGITSEAVLAAHETGRGNATLLLANSFGAPPNSDFYPYVDQRGASDRFQGRTASALFLLRAAPVPILDFAASGAPAYAGQVLDATASMPFHVQRRASAAHGLRYLKGEALSPVQASYLAGYATDYALVRSWMASCRFPADTGPAWGALLQVATDLNPGVAAADARAVWRGIADGPCGKGLSAAQRAWVELFAATGARDAPKAFRHAGEVLALDPGMPPAARAYATLAGAAAGMSIGRRAEARRLLDEQRALLPPGTIEMPWFRYLYVALMSAREKTAAAP